MDAVPHAPQDQEDAAEARWRRPLMGAGVLGVWCMGVAMVSSAGGKSFGGSKFGMDNEFPVFMACMDIAWFRPDLIDPSSPVPLGIGTIAFVKRLQEHTG